MAEKRNNVVKLRIDFPAYADYNGGKNGFGGNGVITHLMEELDELPTYENH